MTDLEALSQWRGELAKRLPGLSGAEVGGLAAWSLGLVLSRSCALTAVSGFWAVARSQSFWTGRKRRAVAVEACFAPLLAWVVSQWQGRHLALALDATTLGERFVVLAISVV